MNYYPVNLNIKGEKVLIFGGGKIAFRKTQGVMKAGAVVKVVSKKFLPEFRELAKEKNVILFQGEYSASQIKDVLMVIAATSDRAINRAIADKAKEKNILVNDCSDSGNSSFINVSTWEKEGVMLTFSTQGRDPRLAKKFKSYCRKNCRIDTACLKEVGIKRQP